MIALFIVSLLCWMFYLYMDAREDYKMGLDGYNFSHKNNFNVRAAAGISHSALIMTVLCLQKANPWWGIILLGVSWSVLLAFFTWLFFDWIFARISNTPAGHIGSGEIDLWFKKKYKANAYKMMIRYKIIALAISLILTTYSLFILL